MRGRGDAGMRRRGDAVTRGLRVAGSRGDLLPVSASPCLRVSPSLSQRRVLKDSEPISLLRANVRRDRSVEILIPLRVLIDKLV